MSLASTHRKASWLDRLLRAFSDVRAGEGKTIVLMAFNVFLVLVAYYVIKTVREPLILASGGDEGLPFVISGPQGKTNAAAAQALVLIPATALYGWLVAKVPTLKLIQGTTIFYIICLVGFRVAAAVGMPHLGFVFYVWVGIFSVAAIAQFWAFANDVYSKDVGERVFPVVMIGMTLGGVAGGYGAGLLLGAGVRPFDMMLVAAGILGLHLALYTIVARQADVTLGAEGAGDEGDGEARANPTELKGAYGLIFGSSYILRIAALLIVANLVNTLGEYILSVMVEAEASSAPDKGAFIGQFYGDFYGTVNIIVFLLQSLVVSRIVKLGGIRAALLGLPIIALGAYALIAAGVGLTLVRALKIAENSTDYSLMGTAKAMVWLPTSHDEKYKAKLAIDTVFVRAGDVLAGVVVAVGVGSLQFTRSEFAYVNLGVILVWILLAFSLAGGYARLSPSEAASEPNS